MNTRNRQQRAVYFRVKPVIYYFDGFDHLYGGGIKYVLVVDQLHSVIYHISYAEFKEKKKELLKASKGRLIPSFCIRSTIENTYAGYRHANFAFSEEETDE